MPWHEGPVRIEVEIDGQSFSGQYEIDIESAPLGKMTVWFRRQSETEEIALHGPDYYEFCAQNTLREMARKLGLP